MCQIAVQGARLLCNVPNYRATCQITEQRAQLLCNVRLCLVLYCVATFVCFVCLLLLLFCWHMQLLRSTDDSLYLHIIYIYTFQRFGLSTFFLLKGITESVTISLREIRIAQRKRENSKTSVKNSLAAGYNVRRLHLQTHDVRFMIVFINIIIAELSLLLSKYEKVQKRKEKKKRPVVMKQQITCEVFRSKPFLRGTIRQ